MNKKNKITLTISIFALIAICFILVYIFSSSKPDTKTDELMDDEISERIEEFREDYLNLLERDVKGAVDLLDENIGTFDKLEATKGVEALLFYLNNNLNDTSKYIKYIELIEYGVEANVEIKDIDAFYNNTPDTHIKDIYTSLNDNLYMIRNKGDSFNITDSSYVDIDYDKILGKYKDYIYDDLIALIEYYKVEKVFIYDDKLNELIFEDVLSNIVKLEEIIEKYPDSAYLDEFKNNLDYNYQIYFGAANDGLGVFDGEGNIYENALKHYKSAIDKNISVNIITKIEKYLEALKDEGYKNTDNFKVFLLNFTNKDYEDYKNIN